jgi:hypothetical protein
MHMLKSNLLLTYLITLSLYAFFFLVGWDWVHLVLRPLLGLLYQPQVINDDCGASGGMPIGRGNRSTRRTPAQEPVCPLQIPRNLPRVRTWVAAVGSRRLTAWAMARPSYLPIYGSTALCWTLVAFFSCLIFTQSLGLLGRGISPSQGRYLHRTTQTE